MNPVPTTLNDIVDVFRCCILTWDALTTMLPAFVLAGAVAAFVPPHVILKYFGAAAKKPVAYLAAAVSGVMLSLCSCNIVPLFITIYRRGAGTGPAFTFLFAGPAINIVSMAFVFQVIGWDIALWRAIAVPVLAVLVGLAMSAILGEKEAAQQRQRAAQPVLLSNPGHKPTRLCILFPALLGTVIFGAWKLPPLYRFTGFGLMAVIVVATVLEFFSREERLEWLKETWKLIKMIIPILIPIVLVIGFIAKVVPLSSIESLVGPADSGVTGWPLAMHNLRTTAAASLFAALMYFPVLTEIAFTKAFLILGMDIGPALAILLLGPGLSLPGAILVARAIGARKVALYMLCVVVASLVTALIFAITMGPYLCACKVIGQGF